MNQIKKILELNNSELKLNTPPSASWHQDYHDSSYIYIGNLPQPMNEMDILIVFSQYGVPTHLKLMRDRQTGESKKFAFLKYERFESCVLAIDNLNGYRFQANGSNSLPLRVDHVRYSPYVYGDGFDANLEWDEALAEEMQKDFASFNDQEEVTKQSDSKGLIKDGAGDTVSEEAEDPMAQFLTDMKGNADKYGRNSTLKRSHHSKRHHHRSNDDGRHSQGHSSRSHRESSRSSGKIDEKHGGIDRNDKHRSRNSSHRSDPSGSSSSSHRSIRHRDSKNMPTKDD